MSQTIWIINQYASTPETGIGGRHFYLARELAKQGYQVYVIAASSHHLLRTPPVLNEDIEIEKIDGFSFVWLNMPEYCEAHSRKRVLNWFLFSHRLKKLPEYIQEKPDVILYSSPSLVGYLGARKLAKKLNTRLVFEVRDIWPLSLIEIGGFSENHPFVRLLHWIEKKAYLESDRVISNLKNAVEHMANLGMPREKYAWVPNGFSLDEVSLNLPLESAVSDQLPVGKFIVGYTGTIGVANALDTLIDAAELVRDNTEIAFVLVGGGKEKTALKQLVQDKKLDNITFISAIPKTQIQAMLDRFDVCYIGWLDEPIYRFGIGANKIPEYLYSGKPVVHAYSGSHDLVSDTHAGITVPAQNPEKLANAFLEMYQLCESERATLGTNGREAALSQYEYGTLAKKLAEVVFEK